MKKRKLLIVAASTLVAVLAFASVAYGANGAAPGDTLYGFDRALEGAGIGDGGLEERLAEAGDLMDEGRVDDALDHAAEALTEEQDDLDENDDGELTDEEKLGRQEALLAAAEAVLANGSEQSLEVRTRVAEKLRWMATTELTGKEFGQAVSALARGVSPGADPETEEDPTHGKGKGADKEKANNGKAQGRDQ